jgi:hypothetical protein
VYIAFGSHGDQPPYHGWLFGYNAATLQQVMVLCTSPNNSQSGIWQSGGGLTVDTGGNIYFSTGNGVFDANVGGVDYGDTVLKINSSGTILDYFTPSNQVANNGGDLDTSTSTAMLLPDQPGPFPHELVQAGKDGNLYLINRDNMGHFNSNTNQDIQTLVNIFPHGGQNGFSNGNYSNPVYFNGWIYYGSVRNNIDAFQLTNGLLSTAPTSKSPETYGFPGAALAISANGTSNGILWAVQRNGPYAPAVLRAYDATNLATELYNSTQGGSRDTLDYGVKFTVPLVANGRVYVAQMSQISVFGLLPVDPPTGQPAPSQVSHESHSPLLIANVPGFPGTSGGASIGTGASTSGWSSYVASPPASGHRDVQGPVVGHHRQPGRIRPRLSSAAAFPWSDLTSLDAVFGSPHMLSSALTI